MAMTAVISSSSMRHKVVLYIESTARGIYQPHKKIKNKSYLIPDFNSPLNSRIVDSAQVCAFVTIALNRMTLFLQLITIHLVSHELLHAPEAQRVSRTKRGKQHRTAASEFEKVMAHSQASDAFCIKGIYQEQLSPTRGDEVLS